MIMCDNILFDKIVEFTDMTNYIIEKYKRNKVLV